MFFLINKPSGISSHDVIYRMRRALGIKRIGHAGTLDPLASGLMIVAVGNDTKLLEYVIGHDKKYRCTFRLGAISTTYDCEGDLTEQTIQKQPTLQDIKRVLLEFSGDIYQTPPLYSAIKIQGKKAYQYAREGQSITIPERLVSIFELTLERYDFPNITIHVHCSSGTYIRSLAHDIGKRLNTGGYVTELVRTSINSCDLKDAIELDAVTKTSPVVPFSTICPEFEYYDLSDEEARKIKMGQAIHAAQHYSGNIVLGRHKEVIVSVLQYLPNTNTLRPKKNLW